MSDLARHLRVLALPALGAAVALTSLTAAPAGEGLEAVAQRQIFGHSVRDRPIAARRAGDLGPGFDVLVVGSIHGDERQGHRIVRALRRAHPDGLKDADLWTVMSVNPDGVARRTRKNAQGVDLNRNFSFRFDPDLDGGYECGPIDCDPPETTIFGGPTGPTANPTPTFDLQSDEPNSTFE